MWKSVGCAGFFNSGTFMCIGRDKSNTSMKIKKVAVQYGCEQTVMCQRDFDCFQES